MAALLRMDVWATVGAGAAVNSSKSSDCRSQLTSTLLCQQHASISAVQQVHLWAGRRHDQNRSTTTALQHHKPRGIHLASRMTSSSRQTFMQDSPKQRKHVNTTKLTC